MKFANNTTVVGFTSGEDGSAYRDKEEGLSTCWTANDLLLNISKTKELKIDYRRKKTEIQADCVERVADFRFLRVHIEESLSWSVNTSELRDCTS